MSAMRLFLLAGFSSLSNSEELHWCGGVYWEDVLPKLSNTSMEVYWAQAPLFSSNPNIGDLLGKFNLYHTAIVFEQDNETAWSLEFDITAQNKPHSKFTAGFLPDIVGDALIWDNDAKWCLTEGVLLTRDHWQKQYEKIADIEAETFRKLVDEFVPSLNGTNHKNSTGKALAYNMYQVHNPLGKAISQDVTCANGAMWIREFLVNEGVNVTDIDWRVTRTFIGTIEPTEVVWEDELEWTMMLRYFRGQAELINGNATVAEKILMLNATLPMRYWFDPVLQKYWKLGGVDFGFDMPIISYTNPPFPWPKTETPLPPTPVPPPRPPSACAYVEDQDFDGGDMVDFTSNNQDDCCTQCQQTHPCIAGVWRSNTIPLPYRKGHCWLKNETSSKITSSGRWACAVAVGPQDCEDISGTYSDKRSKSVVVTQTNCGLRVAYDGDNLYGNTLASTVTVFSFSSTGVAQSNGDIQFSDGGYWTKQNEATPIFA